MSDLRERVRGEMLQPLVRGYRWVSLVLGLYLLAVMPVLYFDSSAPGAPLRTLVTLGAAIVLLGCHGILRSRHMSFEQSQLLVVVCLGAVLLQVLTNVAVMRGSYVTSDAMLWVVASALLLRSRPWFLGCLALGVLGWLTVFILFTPPEHPTHWGIGMVTATLLSLLTFSYLEGLQHAHEEFRIRDHLREKANEHLIAMLHESLENIKTLRGLIPICAQCKKVRDDQGYWQQVEHYVIERSEAQFTHGLCPECAAAMRSEFSRKEPKSEA